MPSASSSAKDKAPPLVLYCQKLDGGFAKCFEFYDEKNKVSYAGKVVNKASLSKPQQKDKMRQEILIHRALKHENIVEFISYFDDPNFVYIILEMCNKKTLMELHKRRSVITEPETRYFIKQIVSGCQYLHSHNIIHRDLKLANLFLNSELKVKIGDFGLATTVRDKNDKKTTMCGTPNYIAPEILTKSGHRFEVDIWSLGCILYTFLVGKPPFETLDLQETYKLIKLNSYRIPSSVSYKASVLISSLLHKEPANRPSMFNVLESPFFEEYTPDSLPESVLTTEPRFDQLRVPLSQKNNVASPPKNDNKPPKTDMKLLMGHLTSMREQLIELISKVSIIPSSELNDYENPLSAPIFWISRWVDYSDKYGLGYELCDNSTGVLFNDETALLMTKDKHNLQFIDSVGQELLFTVADHPDYLEKRIELLTSFKNYMYENLLKTGNHVARKDSDNMIRLPYLVIWMRADKAIVFFLSNGTTQINFFGDHFKLIMCPLLSAITFINENQEFNTFPIKSLESCGVTEKIKEKINYSINLLEDLQKKFEDTFGTRKSPPVKKERV